MLNTNLIRSFSKWIVLLAFIALALLYLNSAIYSAWVSGGPPNPYPVGWSRRALGHLSFSLAATFLGASLFRGIGHFPFISRATLVLLTIGLGFVAAPYVGRFVLADSCLDQGGRWSNETFQCEK
jgi:hypothetical protein